MKALLTHDLKTFVEERGRMVQKSLAHLSEDDPLVLVVRDGSSWRLQVNAVPTRVFDFAKETFGRAIPGGELDALYDGNTGTYGFSYNAHFMRANNTGGVDFVVDAKNLWESFKLIDVDSIHRLSFLVKNRWLINAGSSLYQFEPQKSNFKEITLGKHRIDVDSFVQADCLRGSSTSFLFFEDWVVNEAFLFNPVIVLIVFGKGAALEQFQACIDSLFNIGDYSGSVMLLTNNESRHIRDVIGPKWESRFDIIQLEGLDQLDFVGARLSIFNTPLLDRFRPILYSDVDIVFDREIEGFLLKATSCTKVSAQIEEFHIMTQSGHSGQFLYDQAPFPIGDVHGFNGGLLLVPNMLDHGRYLRACYDAIRIYTSKHGRNSVPFYDQSVLNYTLYKVGDFSPSPVSEHTQVGGNEIQLDINSPKGFVHFWHSGSKAKEMADYIARLKQARSSGSPGL